MDGIKTNTLDPGSAFDDLLGHRDADGIDRILRFPKDVVSAQLAAEGAIADTFADHETRLAAVESLGFTTYNFISQTIEGKATGNVVLASGLINGAVINGMTIQTGKHYFLGSQTAPAENGLYTAVAAGAASRATFADSAAELARIGFVLQGGTIGAGEKWVLSLEAGAITVGTTALNFSLYGVEIGDTSLIREDLGDNPGGQGASPTAFESIVELQAEAGRQRGDVAASTNLATITEPGLYWLTANGGYSNVPGSDIGFNVADNHYMQVEQAGGPDSHGTDRWVKQTLSKFSLSTVGTQSFRQAWSRTLDTANPTTTTGSMQWVREKPLIANQLLADDFHSRGTLTNIDFNAVFAAGVYVVTDATPTNGPPGMTTGLLTVENRGANTWIKQTYVSLTDPFKGFSRIVQSAVTFWPWTPIGRGLAFGKTIAVFGDSVWENGGAQRISTLLGNILSANIIWGGMGGTRMGQHAANYDPMSMYQISDCIANNDFAPLTDGAADLVISDGDDNTAQAANIAGADWTAGVDIAIIPHGRNDKTGDLPIGYATDATGATYKGAINKVIDDFATTHPRIRLVFITPLYSTDGVNALGLTQRDYAEAMIERARAHNCQVIDLHLLAGINTTNFSHYMADTSHPKFGFNPGDFNTNLLIANIIAGSLNAPSVAGRVQRDKTIALAADDQVVPVGDSELILLTSNNATAANRTMVLGPGAYQGHELTLYWNDTDAGELLDGGTVDGGGGTVKLSANWTPTQDDVLKLKWIGTNWVEIGRSAN